MSSTPNHAPSGDDRNLVTVDENYLAPTFEDRLRLFWEKNSRAVIAGVVLVLAVILGKGAFEIFHAQREKAVAADYAAADTDAELAAFVASHSGHVLGGLAQLRIADNAYASGDYAAARAAYDKAASILKSDTFGQRARLGSAVSAVQAGSVAEGEAALKAIVADLNVSKIVRAEAAYDLALLASGAGKTADAIGFIEQATVIDSEGPWAERATLLRSTLPPAETSSVSTAPEALPSVSFK